jgi:hypothetical protein
MAPAPRIGVCGGIAMNIDVVSKWLSAGASVAGMVGVVAGIVGAFVAINTLKQSQRVASAELVLKLADTLENSKFEKLSTEIQTHDQNYPLLLRSEGGKAGGKFHDILIEQYIGIFEEIGYLVEDNLIISKMAFDEFSYDVEKAWCKKDVQRILREARDADKSITRQTDPIYGEFEKLAQNYLTREGESCNDLDKQ